MIWIIAINGRIIELLFNLRCPFYHHPKRIVACPSESSNLESTIGLVHWLDILSLDELSLQVCRINISYVLLKWIHVDIVVGRETVVPHLTL